MTNLFLKVNKDIFKLGLNPTEILILAQAMEFQTNTGDCYISNDTLAEQFGVSTKTISRALGTLEEKGFITRNTRNIKGGKERHMIVNIANIEAALTKDNLSIVKEEPKTPQGTKCPLTRDNLSIDNGQIDSIKDNRKDKEKDNLTDVSAKAETSVQNEPEAAAEEKPEAEERGSISNPIMVEKQWLIDRYNSIYKCANGLFAYGNKYYKMKEI